ncbi:DUF2075 domain-containing protein [Streptomyces sp. AC536]|nr:DUF2075 domain-containing protein [Streptomyces buecherae]QNJ44218.1 DUF2075 domain-containing protein [Streptomyces buecherae]
MTYQRPPSTAEVNSWGHSLDALARLLATAGLEDVEMLVEFALPMCSLRADVVLAGRDPKTGDPAYVVVELKQWSRARLIPGSDELCEVIGLPRRATLHPIAQVTRYCEYLRNYALVLEGHGERVTGVAYLHNAESEGIAELLTTPGADNRLFTRTTEDDFVRFLRETLCFDDSNQVGDELLASRFAPSEALMKVAADEVLHRSHFTLIGEQHTAFSLVMRTLRMAHERPSGTKELVVVAGGPGSGKSVIALSLMGSLLRDGYPVAHATGSRSFTRTLKQRISNNDRDSGSLFTYFNSFTGDRSSGLAVLILDEAHRLRETSNGAPLGSKWGVRRQIDELIDAALVPVFLLDQHQVVRPGETGSLQMIEEVAAKRGLTVRHVDLDGQFRAGGSRAYETWVLRLLNIEPGGPLEWKGDEGRYAVHVAESPEELEDFLRQKRSSGEDGRITAGFCWPWSDPNKDGSLVNDVKIGSWERPWNIKGSSGVGGLPSSDLWATDPAGFGQVGCIYTAQGFEYDWSGVIIGDDLVWREQGWQSVPSASEDAVLDNAPPHEFHRLIRNTYKVLLTRGMKGTVLYSTDPATREFLRALIP